MIEIVIAAVSTVTAIAIPAIAIKYGKAGIVASSRVLLKKRYAYKIKKAVKNYDFKSFRKYFTLCQAFDNELESFSHKILEKYNITNFAVYTNEYAFNVHFRNHKVGEKELDTLYEKLKIAEDILRKYNISLSDHEYTESDGENNRSASIDNLDKIRELELELERKESENKMLKMNYML